jgi:hypothetical protein
LRKRQGQIKTNREREDDKQIRSRETEGGRERHTKAKLNKEKERSSERW